MNRENVQLLVTWMLVVGIVIIAAIGGYYWFTNRTATYSGNRFSIDYPLSWNKAENVAGAEVIFYSPTSNKMDYFRDNLNVVVQDLRGDPMGMAEYTRLAVTQMKVVFKNKITILKSEQTFLDGEPAWRFEFIGHGPETDLQYLSVWTIKDRFAYQVTFAGLASDYNKYLSTVKRMYDSFTINAL